jgi:hypothetical protein
MMPLPLPSTIVLEIVPDADRVGLPSAAGIASTS